MPDEWRRGPLSDRHAERRRFTETAPLQTKLNGLESPSEFHRTERLTRPKNSHRRFNEPATRQSRAHRPTPDSDRERDRETHASTQ
jgi:hypothetical protein